MSASARHFRKLKQQTQRSPKRSTWARRLWFALLGTVVLLITVYIGLQTPLAKGILTATLNRSLSRTGRSIHIEGLTGWLPQAPRIKVFTLADDQGIWLRMEGLHLVWQPGSMLKGHVSIEGLSAERVQILRRPEGSQKSPPANNPKIPNLPGITIQRLHITTLQLEAPLLGHPYKLGLEGSCQVSPRLQTLEGTLTLSGDINAQLQCQLQTNETPTHGSLAAILDTPQGKGAYQCAYQFDQGQLALSDVNLVIPGARLHGDVAIRLPSGLSVGDLQLQLADVGPVASWFGQTVQGRGEAQVQLQIADNTQQILSTWELRQAAWSDLSLETIHGSLNVQDVFGTVSGHGTLAVQGLTRGEQQINQFAMDLQATRHTGLLTLQTDGVVKHPFMLDTQAVWQPSSTGWAVTMGATQVNYHSQQVQLEPGAKLLFDKNTGTFDNWNLLFDKTALNLSGTLLMSPAEPRVAGALQVRGGVAADVTYDATLPLHSHQGQAEIVVTRHNIPVKGNVAYAWSDEALSFSDVHVTTTGLDLSGQAQYQWDTGLIQGQLLAEIPDAYPVTTFLGVPAQAHAQAQFDLRAEQGIQQVQGHWTIEDVNWTTLRLVALQGDVDLQQPWTAPTGNVTARGAGLTWKQMQWDHWTLQAEGDRHVLDLSMLGAGIIDQPLAVDARATVRLDGSPQTLVLHQGLLQYGPETLVLQRPAMIWRDVPEPNTSPRFTLDGWLWQAQNASLLLEGWVSRDRLALQTALTDLSIKDLAVFDTHTLSGQIGATMKMFGSPQQPQIEISAQAQTLRLQEPGTMRRVPAIASRP
ncbi:hypothetical protein ACFL6U_26035, partial [Planctomycetota bacterium]